MSSVFAIAGKTRVYNTDGTGRDTYIGFDNGGNTKKYEPVPCPRQGIMSQTCTSFFGYPKQQSAAVKNVHYHSNGTGRDSYIHVDQGGYMNNFSTKAVNDRYVKSLRLYDTTVRGVQRQIANQSRQQHGHSPQRDYFTEGQISVRSPKARKTMAYAKIDQR